MTSRFTVSQLQRDIPLMISARSIMPSNAPAVEPLPLVSSINSSLVRYALLVLLLAISWLGMASFEGNPYLFILFDVSFLVMAALVIPKPRLYSYTFIAALLSLGFWLKTIIHLIFNTEFLEPIGAFRGSPQEWDLAIGYATMAAIGACIARGLHLWISRRHSWQTKTGGARESQAPTWYPRLRVLLWVGTFALLILLNALNFQVAFYQTGVNPKFILPLHLNIFAGWLINVGFALWFACLIHWEVNHAPKNLASALTAAIMEGLASSVSALSRSVYVMHTVPYYVAIGMQWVRVRGILRKRERVTVVLLWVLILTLSLGIVSWFRIHIYYLGFTPTYFSVPQSHGAAGEKTAGATLANQLRPMAQQVSNLFVSRWTGLEGTLAVSAFESKSPAFLLEALQEGPKVGNDAIYQKLAASPYTTSKAFTFLTLPGFVAILAYSGSMLVILAGATLIVLLAIITEIFGMRLTGNPFLVSVASLATTNVVCQTSFPYLTAVFIVELWIALVFIWGIQRVPWQGKANV